ncbi:tyrosine--tRNA ligase [Bacillota bacterium Meth-B3]|nr:tyrosine--tRNA ligase [Christensenellaceae bacterium]MEA5065809.1 tyrosine--tRNA ligase [Eubacteriales bacterium]
MKNGLDVLRERGFVAQITYEDELEQMFKSGEPITFYTGFDPTADSLHIGHYIPIMAMAHLQRAGHRPIALMGGGTAMIGDPSGKTDLRRMMTVETIDSNVAAIKEQMRAFLDFDESKPNAAIIVDNADWLRQLNYVDFLRDVGALFSVNRMLAADCYKQRYEKGLTFLEFNYMLMQSYDFLELSHRYGCMLQTGGDDQWSNMLSGADLIRRKDRKAAFALTFKLLLTSDGRKMGKTEKGALWLDPKRTSPYEFYQYWRNIDDADVGKCLALLTFLPMEEVRALSALEGSAINEAKRVLAFEVTRLIHGEAEASLAREAAEALFSGGALAGSVPTFEVTRAQLEADNRLCVLAVLCALCKSNGEARRTTLYLNDEKVEDVDARVEPEALQGEGLLLRAGKKKYARLVLKT